MVKMSTVKDFIEKYKGTDPEQLVQTYYDILNHRLTRAFSQGIDIALQEFTDLEPEDVYLWAIEADSQSNILIFLSITEDDDTGDEEVENFFTYKLPDDAMLECAAILEIIEPRLNKDQEIAHWFEDSVNIDKIRDITGIDGINCFYDGEKYTEY